MFYMRPHMFHSNIVEARSRHSAPSECGLLMSISSQMFYHIDCRRRGVCLKMNKRQKVIYSINSTWKQLVIVPRK